MIGRFLRWAFGHGGELTEFGKALRDFMAELSRALRLQEIAGWISRRLSGGGTRGA